MEETKNSLSSRSLPYLPLSYTPLGYIPICLFNHYCIPSCSKLQEQPSINPSMYGLLNGRVHPGQVAISSQYYEQPCQLKSIYVHINACNQCLKRNYCPKFNPQFQNLSTSLYTSLKNICIFCRILSAVCLSNLFFVLCMPHVIKFTKNHYFC